MAFVVALDCIIAFFLCCDMTLGVLVLWVTWADVFENFTRSFLPLFAKSLILGFRIVRSLVSTGVTTAGKLTDLVFVAKFFCPIGLLRGDPCSLSIETVRIRCHAKLLPSLKEGGNSFGPVEVDAWWIVTAGSTKEFLFRVRKSSTFPSSNISLSLLAISFDTIVAIPSNNSTPSLSFGSCGRWNAEVKLISLLIDRAPLLFFITLLLRVAASDFGYSEDVNERANIVSTIRSSGSNILNPLMDVLITLENNLIWDVLECLESIFVPQTGIEFCFLTISTRQKYSVKTTTQLKRTNNNNSGCTVSKAWSDPNHHHGEGIGICDRAFSKRDHVAPTRNLIRTIFHKLSRDCFVGQNYAREQIDCRLWYPRQTPSLLSYGRMRRKSKYEDTRETKKIICHELCSHTSQS